MPATYTGPNDVAQLRTMYLGYIPSDQVNTLAAQIKVKSSRFYTASTGIAQQLALHVDAGFALTSVPDPNQGGGSAGGGSGGLSRSSNIRKNAITGVVSALGAIALIVIGLLLYRFYQRRRAHAHRRLSESFTQPDIRPQGQEFDQDTIGEPRRRSFYYAEDSLSIGAHGGVDDHYDYRTAGPEANMRERPPVLTGITSTLHSQHNAGSMS